MHNIVFENNSKGENDINNQELSSIYIVSSLVNQ